MIKTIPGSNIFRRLCSSAVHNEKVVPHMQIPENIWPGTYQAKGYSADWIEKRMRGIAIREELTDE